MPQMSAAPVKRDRPAGDRGNDERGARDEKEESRALRPHEVLIARRASTAYVGGVKQCSAAELGGRRVRELA